MVKASIAGSIVGNILLVLGAAMLAGGMRHREQSYNASGARSQATMLTLAAIAFERRRSGASEDAREEVRRSASGPQVPPAPIFIEQPGPAAPYYDYPAAPSYDAYTPYPLYPLGFYTYGFAGRIGRHHHFFPGSRARGRSFSRAAFFGRMR